MFKKSQNYSVVDSQEDYLEDRSFQTELDDIKLRRNNPPRFDTTKDWYNYLRENTEDSDISNRFYQSKLSFDNPGFIPTNEGMLEPDDIVNELIYKNYSINRGKVSPEGWKKMLNFGLDPEKDKELIKKNNEIVDRMEKRYRKERGE
jgi:hypothetical protein